MSPENLDDSSNKLEYEVIQLANQLDEETFVMSGGFERLHNYQEIMKHGIGALPVLLANMEEPEWWRLQAIWTLALDTETPIDFPQEARGKYEAVVEIIVGWGKEQGYIADDPPTN